MRTTRIAALAAVSLLALAGCRQTTAGGNEATTWKADIDRVQFDQKPDE